MRKKVVRVWTETITPRETRRNFEQIYFHFSFQVLVLLDLLAPSSSLAGPPPHGCAIARPEAGQEEEEEWAAGAGEAGASSR